MKKIILISTIAIVGCFVNISLTNATVGGPTIIQSLQSSPTNNQEIIYTLQSYSGKGCPPEIIALNIQNQTERTLVSCNDLDYDSSKIYDAKLESTLAKYPTLLKRIDLVKNSISAKITVIKEEKFDYNTGNFGSTDFRLDLYQNDTKKASLDYSGCSKDQLHILEGYTIPGSTSLILLVATKGDCFEGGYATERLFVVPNITLYNQTSLPLKGINEATNTPGNLAVYANANVTPTPSVKSQNNIENETTETPTDTKQNFGENSYGNLAIIGALIVIIFVLIIRRRQY